LVVIFFVENAERDYVSMSFGHIAYIRNRKKIENTVADIKVTNDQYNLQVLVFCLSVDFILLTD